eukprot:GCRY01002023.1.p1 GENE.GCRY01002023.1~~GCRY01002023.1.p1  ORF type:complete len:439 (+),score=70.14 GCRY01002023.1:135-1451(+)
MSLLNCGRRGFFVLSKTLRNLVVPATRPFLTRSLTRSLGASSSIFLRTPLILQLTSPHPFPFLNCVRFHGDDGCVRSILEETDKLVDQNKFKEANEKLIKLLKVQEGEYGLQNEINLPILKKLLDCNFKSGEHRVALDQANLVLSILESNAHSPREDVASAMMKKAILLMTTASDQGAVLPLLRRAYTICREEDCDCADEGHIGELLGLNLKEAGMDSEAETHLRKALEYYQQNSGSQYQMGMCMMNIFTIISKDHERLGESLDLLYSATLLWEKELGLEHPHLIIPYELMSSLKMAEQRERLAAAGITPGQTDGEGEDGHKPMWSAESQQGFADAKKWLVKAVELREKVMGKTHSTLAGPLFNLGMLHLSTDEIEKAEGCLRRSLTLMENDSSVSEKETAPVLASLSDVLYLMGKTEEADLLQDKLIKIHERDSQMQ